MFNHRLRIFASLVVAFIVVNMFGRLSSTPFVNQNLLSRLRVPSLNFTNLLTPQFNSNDQPGTATNKSAFFTLPTAASQPAGANQSQPTLTSFNNLTPGVRLSPTPTPRPTSKLTPTKSPTQKPTPTKYVKPTATPTPRPITTDARPGASLSEIFQDVGKRTCFPPALLHAFQTKETGVFFNYNNPSSIIKIYNTYGWWKTGSGDPCFGLGYHTQTGIVPTDSVRAGDRCRNAVGSSEDLGIMGILQVSQFEEDATRKYTKTTLPNNVDRRVLFDNALIFAIATKNRIGDVPKNCNVWPDDAVLDAAEKHIGVGSCNVGNYCADILKYYKQYK